MFETVQYNINPAGINANIIVNNTGIHFIIRPVLAIGSLALVSFLVPPDCKYCCNHIVTPINIGNIKYGSYTDKSEIHRKCALRIFTEINSALYSAKKIGI